MARMRIRSFQGRIFFAILAVVLIPAAITAVAGTLTLRGIGTRSGTLGAWDAVAESGRELVGSLDSAAVEDPRVRGAADRHMETLSESVRLSRFYSFVARRVVQVVPLAAFVVCMIVAALAFLTARYLSRGFGRPIADLVGWTERIAREEPLPPARPEEERGLEEFRVLRGSLRDMAHKIEEGRERAIEAARMRSWTDLARRVAHEIKNPLTSMRMAAARLARDGSGPNAEAGQVLLEEIERLDDIARTFSRYGKMPEGPRSDVDLLELMHSLADREAAAPGVVSVIGDEPVLVNAHYDALRRAFRNLVLNAIEAQGGSENAEVRIGVGTSDGDALVTVDDRGPGIPDDLLEDIWNPDVTTKRSGTGLGLAIVRRTIELHDGTVEVGNREGGGASFRIRLPTSENSAP